MGDPPPVPRNVMANSMSSVCLFLLLSSLVVVLMSLLVSSLVLLGARRHVLRYGSMDGVAITCSGFGSNSTLS